MRAKNLLGEGSSVMPVAELRVAWIWPICPTIPEEPEASKILEGQLPYQLPYQQLGRVLAGVCPPYLAAAFHFG